MQDRTLLRIAMVGSLLGMVILFLLSYLTIQESSFQELDNKDPGDKVNVKGKVNSVRNLEKMTILELEQQCYLKAIAFEPFSVSQGDYVQVKGTLQEYEGENEIIIESIGFNPD